MTTIKELYDAGQRQFPMRGGGISPVLKYNKTTTFSTLNSHDFWDIDGFWAKLYGESPLDLLPEPLPDTQAKLDAVLAACEAWLTNKDMNPLKLSNLRADLDAAIAKGRS